MIPEISPLNDGGQTGRAATNLVNKLVRLLMKQVTLDVLLDLNADRS